MFVGFFSWSDVEWKSWPSFIQEFSLWAEKYVVKGCRHDRRKEVGEEFWATFRLNEVLFDRKKKEGLFDCVMQDFTAHYVSLIPFVSNAVVFSGICDIWSTCDVSLIFCPICSCLVSHWHFIAAWGDFPCIFSLRKAAMASVYYFAHMLISDALSWGLTH